MEHNATGGTIAPVPGSEPWRQAFIGTLEVACADALGTVAGLDINEPIDLIFADPECFHGVLVGVLGDVLRLRRSTTVWLALATEIAAACAFNPMRRHALPNLPWLSVAAPTASPPGLPVDQLGQLATSLAQRGTQVLDTRTDVASLFAQALGLQGAGAGVDAWLRTVGQPVHTTSLITCTRQAAAVARAGAGAVALILALRSTSGPQPETILEFAHALGSIHALGALYEMRRLRLLPTWHEDSSLALRELVGIQQMRIELGRQSAGAYRALLSLRIDEQGSQAMESLCERTIGRLERSFRIDSHYIIRSRGGAAAAAPDDDAPMPPQRGEWRAASVGRSRP